ncbi:MAG: hypothetical protein RMK99_04860 [Anaerolineales bacterium]|nr:hypothetical protein [Anaerolineales bacterium]
MNHSQHIQRYLGAIIVSGLALAWAAIILAAPRQLPAYSVASASLPDSTGSGWVLISGHAFRCEPNRPAGLVARCEAQIAGQPLTVTVGDGLANRVARPCSASYAGRPVECTASLYASNLASPLPHVNVTGDLSLTGAQLRELRWQNWQANLPEWAWAAFAALTAILLPPAGALWLWPTRKRAWAAALSAAPVLAWVSLWGLISLWYVD